MLSINDNKAINFFKKISEKYNIKIYLVGGAVRDMLLNRVPVDYDFVSEINEEMHFKISREIAMQLESGLEYNEFYHTAKFNYLGYEIDFIMARTESYSHTAAKPIVRSSNISDDLRRRDFTINSMAAALDEPLGSYIIDPFSGREDLKNRLIRVLHDKSFMDDPTRIFRGIKYAARFNFDFEEITWKYLNSSLTQNCLKCLSPGRLKSEFVSILREDNIKSALVHFSKIKIMDSLTDSSVNINRDFDCITFKLAKDIDKFAVLFYKNGLETIIKISDMLQLGKGFAETCIVLGRVECLLHCEDEILYGHLFKNHIRLKDEVLNCLFTKYSRIQNYLRLKERVFVQKINTDNVRVSLRDEYLCTERAKHLIRLIKGGV